jgi:hypothetical protein
VLQIQIWDLGSGAFLTSKNGIRYLGWVESQLWICNPGSGMNNPDNFFKLRNNFFWFFGIKIFKFSDADPGSGISSNQRSGIRDPEWNPVFQEA